MTHLSPPLSGNALTPRAPPSTSPTYLESHVSKIPSSLPQNTRPSGPLPCRLGIRESLTLNSKQYYGQLVHHGTGNLSLPLRSLRRDHPQLCLNGPEHSSETLTIPLSVFGINSSSNKSLPPKDLSSKPETQDHPHPQGLSSSRRNTPCISATYFIVGVKCWSIRTEGRV